MDIDLQIYCCKFYDEDINVKHSYFLFIPGKKDTTTFRINFDQTAQPNEETVNHWKIQPWYHHCIIKKYHMLQPPDKLPQSDLNPFERQWTRWLQGQEVSRKNFQKKFKKKTER